MHRCLTWIAPVYKRNQPPTPRAPSRRLSIFSHGPHTTSTYQVALHPFEHVLPFGEVFPGLPLSRHRGTAVQDHIDIRGPALLHWPLHGRRHVFAATGLDGELGLERHDHDSPYLFGFSHAQHHLWRVRDFFKLPVQPRRLPHTPHQPRHLGINPTTIWPDPISHRSFFTGSPVLYLEWIRPSDPTSQDGDGLRIQPKCRCFALPLAPIRTHILPLGWRRVHQHFGRLPF